MAVPGMRRRSPCSLPSAGPAPSPSNGASDKPDAFYLERLRISRVACNPSIPLPGRSQVTGATLTASGGFGLENGCVSEGGCCKYESRRMRKRKRIRHSSDGPDVATRTRRDWGGVPAQRERLKYPFPCTLRRGYRAQHSVSKAPMAAITKDGPYTSVRRAASAVRCCHISAVPSNLFGNPNA